MKKYLSRILMLFTLLMGIFLCGCSAAPGSDASDTSPDSTLAPAEDSLPKTEITPGITQPENGTSADNTPIISEDGTYTSKDEVALYIHTYNHLPSNYITKKEAQSLGWVSREGNLWDVAYGKSIGGDRFGNYEGLLPEADGRKYQECDIDFDGTYRNAKRIIFSNDGLIYYTEDHYETFEQLY